MESWAIISVPLSCVHMQRHCEQYSKPYMDSFGCHPEATFFEVNGKDLCTRNELRNRIIKRDISWLRGECVPIREMSSFQRVVCTGFNGVGT